MTVWGAIGAYRNPVCFQLNYLLKLLKRILKKFRFVAYSDRAQHSEEARGCPAVGRDRFGVTTTLGGASYESIGSIRPGYQTILVG